MKKAGIIAFAIIFSLINRTATDAASSSSGLKLTTRVLPVVKYEIILQKKNVLITEDDIRRGYIDVRDAVIFSVVTNSVNGYVLIFFAGRDTFKEIEVFCDSVFTQIDDANNEIYMPPAGMRPAVKELSFRFYLSDNFLPGVYDWPVAFAIQAV